jgi:CHAT domain-containing protein/tetratricopeptide (TPR) repeat protein
VSGESKHLNVDQIERLLEVQASGEDRGDQFDFLEEARRHLAICEICQKLVSMERHSDQILRGLRLASASGISKECPTEARFYELAASLVPEEDSERLMSHIVACDHCGPLLRRVTEELAPEQTAEEEVVLRKIKTGTTEWQKAFASRLAKTASKADVQKTARIREERTSRKSWTSAWILAPAGVLIGLGIFAAAMAWQARLGRAESLLEDAYANRRTLELRMPGARHAPLSATRGEDESTLDKPTSLLEAEALIAKKLSGQTRDARWLQEKSRADLLDGNYESAIRTAQQALEAQPNSASLLGDLGSAYFGRAEKTGNAIDYGYSYEWLSKALSKSPDDPVLLFNRAIVSERASLYSQALDDWKHYIRVETDSEWLEEGRNRSDKIEKLIGDREKRNQGSLLGPNEFMATMEMPGDRSTMEIDNSLEQYQAVAIRSWLPTAFSGNVIDSGMRDSILHASSSLADRLRAQHGDSWLSDLLSERHSDVQGFMLLADAIASSERGQYAHALRQARRVEERFERERMNAGRLRAKLEVVYSERLLANGKGCHDDAVRLLSELENHSYRWIEAQAKLEDAACAAEMSNIDESVTLAQEGRNLARTSGYRNLELRSLAFLGGLTEDPEQSFQYLREGLGEFWQGNFDSMRGYSLYAVCDTTADTLRLWNYDAALIREGLHLIENDLDLGLRGMQTYRLARAYVMIDNESAAEISYRDARGLLAKSGSNDLETDVSIYLSEAYLERGRYSDALDLLQSVEPQMGQMSHDILFGRFCSARAAALLGLGRYAEAEEPLARAIDIAERGRGSISDERARFQWLESFRPAYKTLAYLRMKEGMESSFMWWETFKGVSASQPPKDPQGLHSVERIEEQELPQPQVFKTDRAILVSYGVFPERIVAWTYDGFRSKATVLSIPVSQVESLVHRFAAACKDRSSNFEELSLLGHEVYEMLVQPIIPNIGNTTGLLIETEGFLSSIPFEALLNEKGLYLGEAYAVRYSPGLLYGSDERISFSLKRESHALVVGEPVLASETKLAGLPDAGEEAREVAALFVKPRVLLGAEATLSNLLEELPRSEVFHFAGHAIVDREMTRLILSGSTDRGGKGVFALNGFDKSVFRNTRLVVLSACSTMTGSENGLDDRESLARNLLAANVSQVVASRWTVDSRASREWMGVFYRELLAGNSTPGAARLATNAVRSQKELRHPFYWAAFSVFGFGS